MGRGTLQTRKHLERMLEGAPGTLDRHEGMTERLLNFEVMDDEMADILRQKTEVERLRIAAGMWKSARVILRGAIRTEHPDWTTEQVDREIARRISHGVVNHEPD